MINLMGKESNSSRMEINSKEILREGSNKGVVYTRTTMGVYQKVFGLKIKLRGGEILKNVMDLGIQENSLMEKKKVMGLLSPRMEGNTQGNGCKDFNMGKGIKQISRE